MRELGPNEILYILAAVRWTLLLSLVAFVGGGIGGLLVALARTGEFKWLRVAANGYIKLFQGTPLPDAAFPRLLCTRLHIRLVGGSRSAAAIGLSLQQAPFSERSGAAPLVVPRGQWEAAASLGLRYLPKMTFIIAPQAVRIAIPPTIRLPGAIDQRGPRFASIIGFDRTDPRGPGDQQRHVPPFTIFGLVAACLLRSAAALGLQQRNGSKLLVAAR
jgi:polar amino acid transport system permease protein